MIYPRLDDVVKEDDVQHKGTGKFTASYVNWARIARYLRELAPDWQPFAAPAPDGGICHKAPDGTYFLLIGFRHPDPEMRDTECVPHAIMDNYLKAKKNPDARDVTDAFVRGMCKAAALLFGLGWRLWSKDDPFERDEDAPGSTNSRSGSQGRPPEKSRPEPSQAPSQVTPYPSPEEAHNDLAAATTQGELDQIAQRIRVTKFLEDEAAVLRSTYNARRDEIKNG